MSGFCKKKTSYTNYEIIIAENNSVEQETFSYYRELEQERDVKIVAWQGEFNYSAINNFAVRASSGDYLLFLNNDVEVISDCWMEETARELPERRSWHRGCEALLSG